MSRLAGKVVAVTGASAGIGREAALLFAREGARVAVGARRMERLETLAEAMRALGGDVLVMRLDVSIPEEVRGFIDSTLGRFGRLDVLVNNAGYGLKGRVEEIPADACERLMRVNYLGTLYGCQAAVPIMRRQGHGVIINVSSIVGKRALPKGGAYAATKAAQVSLTEALRAELAGSGVHACSVHPIGTDTEFAQVAARESGGAAEGPLGPQQSAARVARAIVDCALRPRREVYPYRLSRLVPVLSALAPGLLDRMVDWGVKRSGRL
jgi:NAD(P)-dependent dehydrogenase (short-subunit alcohol dehydrogenase family)